MPKKKKPRVVLRKKVYVGQPMTLVDRPTTHSLTNPRPVERYLDAMTLSARADDSGGQMISRGTVSRAGIPRKPPVTASAPAARQPWRAGGSLSGMGPYRKSRLKPR